MTEANASLTWVARSGQANLNLSPEGIWRIGRGGDNPIYLLGTLVSRNHAMVQSAGPGQYYVADLGSRNGTFVNGKLIASPTRLKDGDRIAIGDYELSFHQGAEPKTMMVPPVEDPNEKTMMDLQAHLITVLVVDIRGFTKMASEMDSDRLAQMMGVFFREAGQALEAFGARTQKYIGDSVMAVWVHNPAAGHEPVVLSVLDALVRVADIAGGLQQRFQLRQPIRIGAGINTGFASIANLGSGAQSDYTALGEAVNRAFRLETSTKEIGHDLAVGPETHTFLSRVIDTDPYVCQRRVSMHGYNEPCRVYAMDINSLERMLGSVREKRVA